MKLYNSILAIVAIASSVCMSSCSDWLDYTPKDQQTENQQFATLQGFKEAMNGVYSSISNTSLYGGNLSFSAVDALGLCYKIQSANTSWYDFAYYRNTKNSSTVAAQMSSTWSAAYRVILNINMIIAKAEEAKANGTLRDNDYAIVAGEMLGLRAMLHFDLLRLFGPIYDAKPNADAIVYNTSCTGERNEILPASKVVELCLADATKAQQLLEGVDPVINEGPLASDGGDEGNWLRYRQLRFNYYAATLLKARVHMWEGNYASAKAEAVKIADSEAVKTNFPDVVPGKLLANTVNPDRMFSTETFFGFYHKSMSDNIYHRYFDGSAVGINQLWQPRTGYIDALFPDAGDYRRQSQWSASNASGAGDYDFTKYASFTPNTTTPEFYATYYPIMRKTEANYIVAECLIRENDYEGAYSYLNTVRKARGVEALDPAGVTSNEAAMLEVEFEYLREMRGEGQIFFLFKRLQQPLATYDDYYVDSSHTNTAFQKLNGFEAASYSLKVYGSYTAISVPADEL